MIGIITPPIADVSATGEPETPPNSVLATTLASPRPPRQWPTRLRAKFRILSAMPPCSISSPEKMKKGIARNENTFIPETIIWIGVASGSPSTAKVARHASPIANATGTPSTRKSTKLRQRTLSSTDSVVVRAKNELEQAFDAEQADQHAGHDRRQVAERLGDAERGNRVVAGRLGHVQAAPEEQRGKREDEHVDDAAHPALRPRRQQPDDG